MTPKRLSKYPLSVVQYYSHPRADNPADDSYECNHFGMRTVSKHCCEIMAMYADHEVLQMAVFGAYKRQLDHQIDIRNNIILIYRTTGYEPGLRLFIKSNQVH